MLVLCNMTSQVYRLLDYPKRCDGGLLRKDDTYRPTNTASYPKRPEYIISSAARTSNLAQHINDVNTLPVCFMFMGPCIVIYCYSKTNQMHNFFEFTKYHSTCFGRPFRPSSGVQDRTYSVRYMSYWFVDCLLASPRWKSRARQQAVNKPVSHIPDAVCTVLDS